VAHENARGGYSHCFLANYLRVPPRLALQHKKSKNKKVSDKEDKAHHQHSVERNVVGYSAHMMISIRQAEASNSQADRGEDTQKAE
jgi:hypothetical protein